MWVLIDNYDSFTHILHHYLLQAGHECVVVRNDAASAEGLIRLNPSRLILSPGPGRPEDAGITMAAIAHFHDKIPILGICLGHQALGLYFGAELLHAPAPRHGKISMMRHNGDAVFKDVPVESGVMRYHSLSLSVPAHTALECIAVAVDDAAVMGIRHVRYPVIGLQFHPESIGTDTGLLMIKNWAGMFIQEC